MDSISATAPDVTTPIAFPHRRWKNHPAVGMDFPDASTFTCDPYWARAACDALAGALAKETDLLAGIDIGGIGFAGALAIRNGLGFIDVRKVGSIRADVVRNLASNYELGNGVTLSKGHALAGRHVAIIDDCLISGATALATVQLLRRLGAHCTQALFIFELDGLGGRERLTQNGVAVHALQPVAPVQTPLPPGDGV